MPNIKQQKKRVRSSAGSIARRRAARSIATRRLAARRLPRGSRPATAPRRLRGRGLARPRDLDQRPLELEIGRETRPALQRVVELGEPNDGIAELVRGVVPRLREELLDVERMPL